MKDLINFLSFVVVAVMLCGCTWYKDYESDSYVLEYCIFAGDGPTAYYRKIDNTIRLGYDVERSVSFFSKGQDKELYDKICEENGDVSYNRTVHLIDGNITAEFSFYPSLTSIVVTSDKDFDDAHPAGTPLNDYMIVQGLRCANQYITSNYEDTFRPWSKDYRLSELTEDDLKILMFTLGAYTFDAKPDEPGLHTLTFICTLADGRVSESQVDYEFK